MSPPARSATLTCPEPSPSAPDAGQALTLRPFPNTDLVAGCTLALFAVVVTRTGAAPGLQPLGDLPDAGGCHLAQFKSLSPQELQAFKRAKDAFVSLPTAPPAAG